MENSDEIVDNFQEKVTALATQFNQDQRMQPFQIVISLRIAYSLLGSDFEPFVDSVVRTRTHHEISLRLIRENDGQRTVIYMWCHIPRVSPSRTWLNSPSGTVSPSRTWLNSPSGTVSTGRTFIRYSHCGTFRTYEREETQEIELETVTSGHFYPQIIEMFEIINREDNEDIGIVIQEEDDMVPPLY
jgi:hypothetical protein